MRSALIALLLACGQAPEGSNPESLPGPQAPLTPESPPPLDGQDVPALDPVDLGVEMAPTPPIIDTRRVRIAALEAEDGLGSLVQALDPIALEIEAEYWPGRALDPVLHVDDRIFRHYTHPGPGLIRFVLADAAWLDEAQDLSLSYDCPQGCVEDPERLQLSIPGEVQ